MTSTNCWKEVPNETERKGTTTTELAGYGKLLRRMSRDERLNATHISLFTGLFIHWQRNGFASPFAVTRKALMGYSKILSIATYHKCIRELMHTAISVTSHRTTRNSAARFTGLPDGRQRDEMYPYS